jgi:hypothetical protein
MRVAEGIGRHQSNQLESHQARTNKGLVSRRINFHSYAPGYLGTARQSLQDEVGTGALNKIVLKYCSELLVSFPH